MTSRMDKYQDSTTQPVKVTQSRSQKNAGLYQELYTSKVLTEFTEIENNNAIDLSASSMSNFTNRREQFQRNKQLFSENKDFSHKYDNKVSTIQEDITEKNYDINDILDTARKNRQCDEETDKKRHMKTIEYSILSDLNHEKLKEYQERKKKLSRDEEENLEELIHTITSNSLRKKIDDELLSDLLPTEESETVISKELLEEVNFEVLNQAEKVKDNREEDTQEQKIDNSFYTKSMDLSEMDLELNEEDESFLEDTKMSTTKKIIISLFVIFIIGIISYVVYHFI